jgi:hypothetical protein
VTDNNHESSASQPLRESFVVWCPGGRYYYGETDQAKAGHERSNSSSGPGLHSVCSLQRFECIGWCFPKCMCR